MAHFVFVHGINVRGDDAELTRNLIAQRLRNWLPQAQVHACVWGDDLGARLRHGGASIPNYDSARGPGELLPEMQSWLRWQLLYDDPLLEVRLLAAGESQDAVTPQSAQGARLMLSRLAALPQSGALTQLLATLGWQALLAPTLASLQQPGGELLDCLGACSCDPAALSSAVAASVSAQLARNAATAGLPPLQQQERAQLHNLIEQELGGTARGAGAWLMAPFLGLGRQLSTRYLERRRGALSDLACPVMGDIIVYQSRGAPIRQRIADTVRRISAAAERPVFLLAHSLGGIACVDTLLLQPELRPHVRQLFTVGSQAGFFYETGALTGLEPEQHLPPDFPPWTNFYDEADMLSYLIAPLLGHDGADVRINSGQPFPSSHSAYWTSETLWRTIAAKAAS
ncbi:hypothetical protein [Massilia sp. BJB1822]|uniref:hypothetical protein n=1 Tax=Massilia sp. BJB1822 TaxID=2744470 RepID=UPI001593C05D|nr:hypothetical protein [Massilia sp. BJB1822]NVD99436.1 hypothetical protein [Massilia sp. BJB1822]